MAHNACTDRFCDALRTRKGVDISADPNADNGVDALLTFCAEHVKPAVAEWIGIVNARAACRADHPQTNAPELQSPKDWRTTAFGDRCMGPV